MSGKGNIAQYRTIRTVNKELEKKQVFNEYRVYKIYIILV
jgi:hypothetical protein